jgi:hypothetical protein
VSFSVCIPKEKQLLGTISIRKDNGGRDKETEISKELRYLTNS